MGEQPLLEIGKAVGDPGYQLYGVVGAVRLSTGDIVLADGGSGELRRYDRDGTFVWRAAGDGEGPGEHRSLSFLGVLAGDSLVSYDNRLWRVQIFAADGELARTIRVEPPWCESRPRSAVGVSGRQLIMNFTDGAYCSVAKVAFARLTFARISSAAAVHLNGAGSRFRSSM